MEDWKKRLVQLLLKHPEFGVDPDALSEYTDDELRGIYRRLRNSEPE